MHKHRPWLYNPYLKIAAICLGFTLGIYSRMAGVIGFFLFSFSLLAISTLLQFIKTGTYRQSLDPVAKYIMLGYILPFLSFLVELKIEKWQAEKRGNDLVEVLENHKQKKGFYPSKLKHITIDTLHYEYQTDQYYKSFELKIYLPYQNDLFYKSKNKEWEEIEE